MAYSLKLAQKILDGATRKSLRADGFKFSQKLFQELRAGPLRALGSGGDMRWQRRVDAGGVAMLVEWFGELRQRMGNCRIGSPGFASSWKAS